MNITTNGCLFVGFVMLVLLVLLVCIFKDFKLLMGIGLMSPSQFTEWLKGIEVELLESNDVELNRREKIDALKMFYCHFFAEDKRDGSSFDVLVLNALEEILK